MLSAFLANGSWVILTNVPELAVDAYAVDWENAESVFVIADSVDDLKHYLETEEAGNCVVTALAGERSTFSVPSCFRVDDFGEAREIADLIKLINDDNFLPAPGHEERQPSEAAERPAEKDDELPKEDEVAQSYAEVLAAKKEFCWADDEDEIGRTWVEATLFDELQPLRVADKPKGVVFDESWSGIGKILNRVSEVLKMTEHTSEPVRVSAIRTVAEPKGADPAVVSKVEFLAGFCKIFAPNWSEDLKKGGDPEAKGFRDAGRRLMRALNFKNALKSITRVFGDNTEELKSAVVTMSKLASNVDPILAYLELLIRRFAAFLSVTKKVRETEAFWRPRRVVILQKLQPLRKETVERKEGKKTVKSEKTVVMTCAISAKAREFASAEESVIISRWNEETSIPKWKLSENAPLRFSEECEVARKLLADLNIATQGVRKVLHARKEACHRAFVQKYPKDKKEEGDFKTFAQEYCKEKVTGVDATIGALVFDGAQTMWDAAKNRVLAGDRAGSSDDEE